MGVGADDSVCPDKMLKLSKKKKPADDVVTEALTSEVHTEEADKKPALKRKKQPSAPKAPQEQKAHKVINSLVGNLSHALAEDVSQIDDMLEEKEKDREKDKAQPKEYHNREKKPAKYRFFLVFGLLVFWLAIVGALSVFQTAREIAYDISNQTALKQEFERFLFPVVVNDPPEFTGAENLPPSTIIASAIWDIMLTGDTSYYERDFDSMTIPENDVEAAVRSIFGFGFDIRHVTVDNIIFAFRYSEANKSYTVPMNLAFVTFSPRVTEISSTRDVYTLMVDYIAPSPRQIAGIEYEPEPVKTMIYTVIRLRDGTKTIQSIELNREALIWRG
jgi:hypothetical protein